MDVFEELDRIAEEAFDALRAAKTETEKNEIRDKIRNGEYVQRMNAMKNQVPADTLTTFNNVVSYFRRCADDDSLIGFWRLLA